ncbi:MAG: M20/M25/M40 family metallo-hydrolase [Pseudomonadota bacterium]|nr:M20/M25/M40 family metallo-hydrolase [Pseudomonadota bacterium]
MKACRALGPVAAAMLVFSIGIGMAHAAAAPDDLSETMGLLKHAISIRTVEGQQQVPILAAYLADKLKAGGFAAGDVEIIPVGETAALAARYRGTGKGKPILLSGHMDVVVAKREDWIRDPFTLIEENGYLYGRGVADMKTHVVVLVETLIRLKREGFKPSRDLILLLSGDEETTAASTRELVKRYHDAEFLLNADGISGSLDTDTGKPTMYFLQAAEKTYADFQITVTAAGGHSSEPSADNAIYRLAHIIERVAAYQFPLQSNPITLASMRTFGAVTPGPMGAAMTRFAAHPDDAAAAAVISADPESVGQIRTTCVATMLNGGHALNALPQRASVDVNCRIFPGTSVDSVRTTLTGVIDDASATLTVLPPPPVTSPPSPLRADVIAAATDAVHERFPGVIVVPGMSAGASDSMYFRNAGVPSYGISGTFAKPNDTFMHGLNERLPASEVAADLAFWHHVLIQLAK